MRSAAVAILALALLATGAAGAAREQATLRIVKVAPLTVRGAGFAAGQQVQVVATTARSRARVTARTAAEGTFTARFSPFFAVEPCHGTLVITATGRSGTRATAKRPCRPADPLP